MTGFSEKRPERNGDGKAMMDFLYLSPEFPLTAPCSSIASTVVDLYDACARMVMGETVVLPREKKYYCACGQQSGFWTGARFEPATVERMRPRPQGKCP